jgi:hypothetical protein
MFHKTLPIFMAIFVSLFILPASKSHSMTFEEFIKILGVVNRYGEDIQRTFPDRFNQSTPRQTPKSKSKPNFPPPSTQEEEQDIDGEEIN